MRNRIRELRESTTDLTQETMARALGVSRQTINSIESGRYEPKAELALQIARLLKFPMEEVFILDDDTNADS